MDLKNPARHDCYFYDPLDEKPPKGVNLLLLTKGGVCVIGKWNDEDFVAWSYKLKIPKSVKERMNYVDNKSA